MTDEQLGKHHLSVELTVRKDEGALKCDRCLRWILGGEWSDNTRSSIYGCEGPQHIGEHPNWPGYVLCTRCVGVLLEIRWPSFDRAGDLIDERTLYAKGINSEGQRNR